MKHKIPEAVARWKHVNHQDVVVGQNMMCSVGRRDDLKKEKQEPQRVEKEKKK